MQKRSKKNFETQHVQHVMSDRARREHIYEKYRQDRQRAEQMLLIQPQRMNKTIMEVPEPMMTTVSPGFEDRNIDSRYKDL